MMLSCPEIHQRADCECEKKVVAGSSPTSPEDCACNESGDKSVTRTKPATRNRRRRFRILRIHVSTVLIRLLTIANAANASWNQQRQKIRTARSPPKLS